MFSLIIYYAFYEKYVDNEGVEVCDSLLECFSVVFDSTFKNDGGFSGLFGYNPNLYVENDFIINVQAIFEFLYNFLVLILIIEILSGIIIDTFAELR